MLVFAQKGFDGASLSDLTSAMKINRFSMYATFGNKEALYVKAMEAFNDVRKQRVVESLRRKTARESVELLLRECVSRFTEPGHGVCFVTQEPLTSKEVSNDTRRLMAKRRGEVEQAICSRLAQGIKDGELPRDTSAEDLARLYAVMIQGFALQAQHGGTREELFRTIDIAMENWPGKSKKE